MSFEFPSGLERDIQQFAQSEHISTDEALVKLVRSGLSAIKMKTQKDQTGTGDLTNKSALQSVQSQLERLKSLGDVSALDSADERRTKLKALFSLSDAAIAEGMETWTTERILDEVAERRGTNKTNLY